MSESNKVEPVMTRPGKTLVDDVVGFNIDGESVDMNLVIRTVPTTSGTRLIVDYSIGENTIRLVRTGLTPEEAVLVAGGLVQSAQLTHYARQVHGLGAWQECIFNRNFLRKADKAPLRDAEQPAEATPKTLH